MSMPSQPLAALSLIIPAWNEKNTIEGTTRAYARALNQCIARGKWEIILVSNNCSDETPSICASLAHEDPSHIRHENIPSFVGKGGAVLRGFSLAKHPFISFVDADNAVEPDSFVKLIPFLSNEKVGAVIASRSRPDSVLLPAQPWHRRFLGLGFTLVRELLFGLGIGDSQCGAKIFRREAIQPFQLSQKGWAFDVALLARTKNRGFRIEEVGVVWRDKPGSKVEWHAPIKMFGELVRLRFSNEIK